MQFENISYCSETVMRRMQPADKGGECLWRNCSAASLRGITKEFGLRWLCKFDNVKTFLTRSLSRVSEGKTSCDSKQRWSGGRIKKKERGFDRVINRSDPNLSLVYSPSYLTITLRYIPFALTKLETSASETLNIARFTLFPNTPPVPQGRSTSVSISTFLFIP